MAIEVRELKIKISVDGNSMKHSSDKNKGLESTIDRELIVREIFSLCKEEIEHQLERAKER